MKKFKTVTKKTLQKRNDKFKALTNKKKRLAIAKDVILAVNQEKFIPKEGYGYYTLEGEKANEDGEISYDAGDDVEVQGLLNDGMKCNCCAMGAVLMSKIRLGNDCTLGKLEHSSDSFIIRELEGIFSRHELRTMEHVFEGEGDFSEMEFYKRYNNAYDRLIAIMENVIENDGEFIVPEVVRPVEFV